MYSGIFVTSWHFGIGNRTIPSAADGCCIIACLNVRSIEVRYTHPGR